MKKTTLHSGNFFLTGLPAEQPDEETVCLSILIRAALKGNETAIDLLRELKGR